MNYLLTLDAGTTAVKAGLFTQALEPVGFAVCEYTLQTPRPGYVELSPETYWDCAVQAVRRLLAETGADGGQVLSVTCTTQGETMIPVDADHNALGPAIVWLDARAEEQAAQIAARVPALTFYQKTGLPEINAYCPVAKLLWFRQQQPDLYRRARNFLLLEDYLILRLCGHCVTNPSLQSSTGWFDIFSGRYWTDLLQSLGLDVHKLPPVVPCGTAVAPVTAEAAVALGISAGAVITTGAMDQAASAVGAGDLTAGCVTETTGTCQTVAAAVAPQVPQQLSPVTIYCHAVPDMHLQIVISQTAGIVYKWFRDNFCADLQDGDAFARMDRLAAQAPAGCRGLLLSPQLAGTQFPRADPAVRGVFLGVGLDTDRACFIRSILEGVAYLLRDSLEQMHVHPTRILTLGGGAKSSLWCTIKAGVCGVPLCAPAWQESTSLGAALLGARALGLVESLVPPAAKGRTYDPDPADQAAYERMFQQYKTLSELLPALYHRKEPFA